MDICIYTITNKKNGMFYLGYSKETSKRFRSHLNMLRRNDHHCVHLQRAWNIDGEDSFLFERIIYCTSVSDAINLEQIYLDQHFKTGVMYNSSSSNDLLFVIKHTHTKEAIKKSADARKSSPLFAAALAKNRLLAVTPEAIEKRVAAAKINGNIGSALRKSVVSRHEFTGDVVVYKSIKEAARSTNTSAGNIHSCCNGFRSRVNNYLFSYALIEHGFDELKAFEQ